jgi:hypothetical protein
MPGPVRHGTQGTVRTVTRTVVQVAPAVTAQYLRVRADPDTGKTTFAPSHTTEQVHEIKYEYILVYTRFSGFHSGWPRPRPLGASHGNETDFSHVSTDNYDCAITALLGAPPESSVTVTQAVLPLPGYCVRGVYYMLLEARAGHCTSRVRLGTTDVVTLKVAIMIPKLCLIILMTMLFVEPSCSFQLFALNHVKIPSLPFLVRSSDGSLASTRLNSIRLKSLFCNQLHGSLFVSERAKVIIDALSIMG